MKLLITLLALTFICPLMAQAVVRPNLALEKKQVQSESQPVKRAPATNACLSACKQEYADCIGSNCQYTYSRCKTKCR